MMQHTIKPEYTNEDGNLIPAVIVEAPDVLWLQVANYECPEEAADRDEWTYAYDDPVMESDVAYVPRVVAEALEVELRAARFAAKVSEKRVAELDTKLAAAANVWQGLAVSVAQHYEQAAEEDGAAYELRRLAGLAGLPVSADSAHEVTEELAVGVARVSPPGREPARMDDDEV